LLEKEIIAMRDIEIYVLRLKNKKLSSLFDELSKLDKKKETQIKEEDAVKWLGIIEEVVQIEERLNFVGNWVNEQDLKDFKFCDIKRDIEKSLQIIKSKNIRNKSDFCLWIGSREEEGDINDLLGTGFATLKEIHFYVSNQVSKSDILGKERDKLYSKEDPESGSRIERVTSEIEKIDKTLKFIYSWGVRNKKEFKVGGILKKIALYFGREK
jgi:hypothetical protein